MRTIFVNRYVTPLREGGSLPAIVEGDDLGVYVLKFRGAGQGVRALMAEIIAGGIAHRLGLPMPEVVLAQLDPALAQTEPDPEIQDLIRASAGRNVALDYLSGALNFDPAVDCVTDDFASRLVWFDAFIGNVDRTARNTNLLMWHRQPWLIDHGASLTFHHAWKGSVREPAKPFAPIADHVLLPQARLLAEVDADLAARLTPDALRDVLAEVPDDFLLLAAADADPAGALAAAGSHRQAYVDYLLERLAGRELWVKGAINARA